MLTKRIRHRSRLAILLLPVCAGAGMALWKTVRACGAADTTLVPFGAGALCWLAIYLLLPRPMWIYVFGHELTHALWTWVFGGEVRQFKASASGGHVIISKTNFVIALAPYFFPLYAVLLIAGFGIGKSTGFNASMPVWAVSCQARMGFLHEKAGLG